jgi:alkylated DNA repair dioxygenase AlkB
MFNLETGTECLVSPNQCETAIFPVNHVFIKLYCTGADYISEHSDKTIDVVRGSHILNLSLGTQRAITLQTSPARARMLLSTATAKARAGMRRATQRIPLPHNSLLVMGLASNARWVHSVHTDKRPEETKDLAERRPRISLTFRHIGNFLTLSSMTTLAGQGRAEQQQRFIFGRGATG